MISALETRPEEELTRELVTNKLLSEFKRRTESMITDLSEPKVLNPKHNVHKEQNQTKNVFSVQSQDIRNRIAENI